MALAKNEARAIGAKKIDELHIEDVTGGSGTVYQVEIVAFWDGGRRARDGNLRVMVAVDDRGWSAVSPLTDDFIIAPTGEFIGE